MKFKTILILLLVLGASLFAQGSYESQVIASNSWTAGIADLAGVEDIVSLAPATMNHPPEYELKASDILALTNAKAFIFGGYEVMMKEIKSSIVSETRKDIKVTTANNLNVLIEGAEKIAAQLGTTPKYDSLIETYEAARAYIKEKGVDKLNVYCNTMLKPMLDDLGFNVVAVYSNNSVTADDIVAVASGEYDLIIDNIHSPGIDNFKEVAKVPIITFRNFPLGSIEELIIENMDVLKTIY